MEEISSGIWVRGNTVRSLGVRFTGRMTVVQLSGGGLWLHSPVPIDDALGAELTDLGPVQHVIAPNCFHHLFALAAKSRFPDAVLWGPVALQRKRPKLAFDATLGPDAAEGAAWGADFDYTLLEAGPKMVEAVFHHRASRTLILTDLLVNLPPTDHWWTRTFMSVAGGYPGLKQSKLWRWLTKEPDAAKAAIERILEWPFERVILAHGSLVEGPDARERLRAAWWWMLGEAAPAA